MSGDQGTFTPLVFLRAENVHCFTVNQNLSKVKNWTRTRLNFNLIRSCLSCLRGSRSIRKETIWNWK